MKYDSRFAAALSVPIDQFYPHPSSLLLWHWVAAQIITQVPLKQPWRVSVNDTRESTKMIV